MNNHFVYVWEGERKLLPVGQGDCRYDVQCVEGEGYLRLMSKAERRYLSRGDSLTIDGGEVATISGRETMVVKIIKKWKE